MSKEVEFEKVCPDCGDDLVPTWDKPKIGGQIVSFQATNMVYLVCRTCRKAVMPKLKGIK